MNPTLPGGDVRGFYAALGVQLPGWAHTEAPVRCFADPDAHAHQDRDPSCSVNVHSGAFNCHACGAHGGAYDAALAVGRSPREAIDLMITHGLTERRPRRDTPRESAWRRNTEAAGATRRHGPNPPAAAQRTAPPAADQPDRQRGLSVSAEDVNGWARALRDARRAAGASSRRAGLGARDAAAVGDRLRRSADHRPDHQPAWSAARAAAAARRRAGSSRRCWPRRGRGWG